MVQFPYMNIHVTWNVTFRELNRLFDITHTYTHTHTRIFTLHKHNHIAFVFYYLYTLANWNYSTSAHIVHKSAPNITLSYCGTIAFLLHSYIAL